jgi:L-malate glycosyltransferase
MVANLKQYRSALFPMLFSALAPYCVELSVIYSKPNSLESSKGDNIDLPPPLGRRIPALWFVSNRLLLQFPRPHDIFGADLIIVVQATGYLFNYPLLLLSALRLKRVAFWGHGKNLQGDANSLSERLKRLLANSTDWWFAYTRETRAYLETIGVSSRKITVVDNATDTRGFRATLDSVSDQEIESMKSSLGLQMHDPIGLYCGSLYREKRVDYLLGAAKQIADIIPGFRLLVVGAGPEADIVRQAGEAHDFIRYLGPAFGRAKAVYFRMADVCLNPGLVGLGILDSFTAGLPLITTADARHSPEIAYLVDGQNGMVVSGDSREFAMTVSQVLQDSELLATLKQGAITASVRYTIENMAENMKSGILESLGISRLASTRS